MCLCDDTKRTEPERVSQALERVHSGVSKLPGPHKIRNCRRIADRVLISTTPTGESEPSTSPNFPPTLIFARDSRAPWRPHEALACICASWPLVGKGTHEGRERARTGGMNWYEPTALGTSWRSATSGVRIACLRRRTRRTNATLCPVRRPYGCHSARRTVQRSISTTSPKVTGKSRRTCVDAALPPDECGQRFGVGLVLHRIPQHP